MSIEKVRKHFEKFGIEDKILEFEISSATVELAAIAAGVIPGRIAKTLSFKVDGSCVLVVTAGDVKIDNSKFKKTFKVKAKMLKYEEVFDFIGHNIGGVCPFAVNDNIKTYLDESLRRFDTIFPACGSANSAIELDCNELFLYSNAVEWVDVCKIKIN